MGPPRWFLHVVASCLLVVSTVACSSSEVSSGAPADGLVGTPPDSEATDLPGFLDRPGASDPGSFIQFDLGKGSDQGDVDAETGAQLGAFGDPCVANRECGSDWCIEGYEGYICTKTCIEDCPEGYKCKGVLNAFPDIVFLCVPNINKLCRPCTEDAQCNGGKCMDVAGKRSCTVDCSGEPCPENFTCTKVDDEVLGLSLQLCMPDTGSCDCTEASEGQTRPCTRTNPNGTCQGFETCDPAVGWTGCDAQEPTPEICNGLDDDCDGGADEGLPASQACAVENEHGVCPGLAFCFGSAGWVCNAPDPHAEVCDYQDNDCDGLTDESFKNEAGAYAVDAHCGACLNGCEGTIPNAETSSCDGSLALPVCVVETCAESFYKDNDFLCLPLVNTLCQPCAASSQCGGGVCLSVETGTFCSKACDESGCPDGFTCQEVAAGGEGPQGKFCLPQNGSCTCNQKSVGQKRACTAGNAIGTCVGFETCDPTLGWVDCDAPTPAEESCDGVDNDCDGLTDEGVGGGAACTRVNGWGTCAGTEICLGTAGPSCNAPEPAEDVCDGLDNDCSGVADDPFKVGGKYLLDGHCGGCFVVCDDLIGNGSGTCKLVGDTPTCVVQSCEDGFYAFNDFLCLPIGQTHCQPCSEDVQCGGGVCRSLAGGGHCTFACAGDSDCPASFHCGDLTGGEQVCLPDNGTCDCNAANDGAKRPCEATNTIGTCVGFETCDAALGWVGCTASTPAEEECDGADDDCNGLADDDLPVGSACTRENTFGSCGGTRICGGGLGWICTAQTPAAESCNFKDDDCDGVTDEPWLVGGKYVADDNCGICGASCAGTIANGKAVCDGSQDPPVCVVESCDKGFFSPNPFACLPVADTLCQACTSGGQCGGGICTTIGAGAYCTQDCSESACPSGFACTTVEGKQWCMPDNGSCDCTAANAGEKRSCKTVNAIGTCFGFETCDPQKGWVGCDAPAAEGEICDGKDNDCNTLLDDGLPASQPCSKTNAFGSCDGIETCFGTAGWVCAAPEPQAESCNFKDDDCDGQTDEDFRNAQGKYALFEHCGTCQASCAGKFAPHTAVCDGDRATPDCVIDTCAEGFYKANDFQCLPIPDTYCQPCQTQADCFGKPCVALSDGSFCATVCQTSTDCQTGQVCVDAGPGKACVPENDNCTCGPANDESRRTCSVSNPIGTCFGFETCDAAEGWLPCGAPAPAEEECDGKDNDCNGFIDDGFDSTQPCTRTNTFGTCEGTRTCFGSAGWLCSAPEPAADICNFKDDDCDGQTDEDFKNPAGKYTAFEHCGSCTTSCASGFPNADAVVCDANRDPPACVVQTCAPGFFKLNDFQCIPDTAGLCETCSVDANCTLPGARCLQLADAKACLKPCTSNGDCPSGFACQSQGAAGLFCTPATNSCTCDGTNPDLQRACQVSYQPPGGGATVTCLGFQQCTPAGWSGCQVPGEVCNEADDDCNGQVDEGFRNSSGVYDKVAHCGKCNNNCAAISYPNADPACDATSAAAPFCTFACKPNFFDLDQNPGNGCECAFQSTLDLPADGFDSNCDGVDGEIAKAIFVAKDGNDGNPGTLDMPMLTIQAAIDKAGVQKKRDVIVATGVYSQSLDLLTGVSVYGGYSGDFRVWSTLLYETVIMGTTNGMPRPGAVNAVGISGPRTHFAAFTLFGKSNKTAGGSSYVLYIRDSDDTLVIRNNRIVAGDGGKGTRGPDGGGGEPGASAKPGKDAKDIGTQSCKNSNPKHNLPGGAGGQKVCPGGVSTSGGTGGMSRCPKWKPPDEYALERGQDGANSPGSDGKGGGKGYDLRISWPSCGSCVIPPNQKPFDATDGADGAVGQPGGAGSAGKANADNVIGGLWSGADGGDGGNGGHGGGGGGGGGGSGVELSGCQNDQRGDDLGGTGGGGGAGGCGGTRGFGGTAGGGSFGIFLVWSSPPFTLPVIESNSIERGFGGSGGGGGNGGTGGAGGKGALGGAEGKSGTDHWCARSGGKGGEGGLGGHAGGGGGAAGGVSFGIFAFGQGGVDLSFYLDPINTFAPVGGPGAGGPGGLSLGMAGKPGDVGASGKANF